MQLALASISGTTAGGHYTSLVELIEWQQQNTRNERRTNENIVVTVKLHYLNVLLYTNVRMSGYLYDLYPKKYLFDIFRHPDKSRCSALALSLESMLYNIFV